MFTATVQQLKTHRGMVARAVSRWKLPGARIAFAAWLEYVAEQQFEAMATSEREMSQQLKSTNALEVQLLAKNQQLQDFEGRLATSVQSATELEEKIVQLQGELSEMRYTSSKTESESGKRVRAQDPGRLPTSSSGAESWVERHAVAMQTTQLDPACSSGEESS